MFKTISYDNCGSYTPIVNALMAIWTEGEYLTKEGWFGVDEDYLLEDPQRLV